MRNILYLLVVLLSPTIVLSSCGTDVNESALVDRVWTLETYGEPDNVKSVLKDTEITITFDSGKGSMTGSAGCNSYFGEYEVKANRLSIPGPIAATEMACLEPEGVMEQETLYLTILKSAKSYQIQGNELRIDCGDQVLIYTSG